jgi:hypothetical protein
MDFENYRGNELEVGHYGPKIEAKKDETLSQYLQDVVRRHQSSLLDLRHPDFYKDHEIRVILKIPLSFYKDISALYRFSQT